MLKDDYSVPMPKKATKIKKEDVTPSPTSPRRKPVLPILKLDLTKEPSEQILTISDKDQSKHLGWKLNEVRSVNSHLNLYDSLPMVCNAESCYWAKQCPTRPDYKFRDYLCPLETMDIYRFFVGYVRDLDIQPTDYVDLRLVEDLVRIDLQMKRVDQQLQIAGMEADKVGGIIQSIGTDSGGKSLGGKAVYEKTVHPLLLQQDKYRARRKEIHVALIANRAEKFERDRKEGKAKQDITDMFEKIIQYGKAKSTISEVKTSAIEAEYSTEEDLEGDDESSVVSDDHCIQSS